MDIKFDQAALNRLGQQVVKQAQPTVDRAVQQAIRRVRDRYQGGSVDEVCIDLERAIHAAALRAGGGNVQLDKEVIRGFAAAIVAGTLAD